MEITTKSEKKKENKKERKRILILKSSDYI